MSMQSSSLKNQILLRIYEMTEENPQTTIGSETFKELGDMALVHEAIIDLGREGLITHLEPIETGVIPTIRRIPGIRITSSGRAAAERLR